LVSGRKGEVFLLLPNPIFGCRGAMCSADSVFIKKIGGKMEREMIICYTLCYVILIIV